MRSAAPQRSGCGCTRHGPAWKSPAQVINTSRGGPVNVEDLILVDQVGTRHLRAGVVILYACRKVPGCSEPPAPRL